MQSTKKISLLILILFISYTPISLAQSTLYVSPEGNNNNSGTIKAPFQTIDKALAVAQQISDEAVQIQLREGTYYLPAPLIIEANKKALTLTAYNNEIVVISGGNEIEVDWKKVRRKKYLKTKVTHPGFDQLYINGEKRILARYPNYQEGVLMNGTAEDAISSKRVRSWKNPKGGLIHALHTGEWGGMHYKIEGKEGDQLIYNGGFQNNRPSNLHQRYRYVENIFEELDAPGEWFFDKEEQTLYYYPYPNENLADAKIEVSNIASLIELRGTTDQSVKNVTIKDLHFTHTSRTIMEAYEPLTRSDWQIHRGGAVFMENAEDCTVQNNTFTQLGGNAIFISGYANNCDIKSNHIHHIGASAVALVGHVSSLRSPSFEYREFVPFDELDQTPGPKNNQYPRQCTVEDNLIHHIGEIEKQVAGVQIQIAAQLNIRHNTIYQVPRSGINIGDGAFGGHILEYNDVFETVLETSDHGAFNSWGRDRFWHPNYQTLDTLTANHPHLILLDALYQTIIRNNRFRCDHGWDIDLDDGSSNYHIYNNLCLSGGIKLREGFYRIAENNILINNTLHPHVWFKNSGDVVQRNIMMNSYRPIELQDWGKSIDYNFFPSQAGLEEVQKYGVDAHSIAGTLEFKDPENADFTVVGNKDPYKIGFENFPMDRFGVYSPHLKAMADTPDIPTLIMSNEIDLENEYEWLDGTVRGIKGLEDRSAYGLPDETGVVIVATETDGVLSLSDIQKGDVIRSLNDRAVETINDIFTITNDEKWKGSLKVKLYRNQQLIERTLTLKR